MTTLPRRLLELAAARPAATALQEKRYGIWHPISWAAYAARVRELAHGLATLGVARGDVVGIVGDNRPEWLIAELAAQCLGAAVVGAYPTSSDDELRHVLARAEVRVVVAEDQEQVDKLVRIADGLSLAHVIYYDPHGLEHYRQPYLARFTDVAAAGRRDAEARPGWLDAQIAAGDARDRAVVCATPGTTGQPKLAVLSHGNLLAMAAQLHEVDPLRAGQRYVSFLPLAWIGEQMLAVACGLAHGLALAFPEDAATQRADLREIGPDVVFGPPRIWETMLGSVQARIDDAGPVKRRVFGWAYGVGDAVAALRGRGARPGPALAAAHRIADVVGLAPVRDQLGLSRVVRGYCGGAALAPEVLRFFRAIGVNLKQLYGQTESCGVAVCQRDGDVRPHTVGTPLPGTELRIADDGEILLRSPSVSAGYLGADPAVDGDGWLHTGDAGELDGEHLVVIDRRADVLRHAGGRHSSALIENKLKFSPYIEEAMAFAAARGICAIVCIDPDTTGAWAEQARIAQASYRELAASPEVGALIAEEIARANAELPAAVRVQRFAILHRPLDADDEVTRTRKLRRAVIAERLADLVAAIARGDDAAALPGDPALAIRAPLAAPRARPRPLWSRRSR